jgi:hypothetical protein
MITFYCLRFETPPTWRARSPYLHSVTTHRSFLLITVRRRDKRHRLQAFYYVLCNRIVSETIVITLVTKSAVVYFLWRNPRNVFSRCLAKWVVPCLAPLFRLLDGVYRAVAWRWTPDSDSTTAAFRRCIKIV